MYVYRYMCTYLRAYLYIQESARVSLGTHNAYEEIASDLQERPRRTRVGLFRVRSFVCFARARARGPIREKDWEYSALRDDDGDLDWEPADVAFLLFSVLLPI